MKPLFSALLLAGTLALSTGSARADLVMKQKIPTAGEEKELTTQVKGDLARMDVGKDLTIIVDSKTGDTTTLMHAMKTAMKVDANAMKSVMDLAAKFGGLGGQK